jgi:putative SOS response-associated peptidase YedK
VRRSGYWHHRYLDNNESSPVILCVREHRAHSTRQHSAEPRRIFVLMRWGVIPYWAKDQSFGLKTINAMSETATEKTSLP